MSSTLAAFRKEWSRPAEDVTMFSWYNLLLKLRMSDAIPDDKNEVSVLENVVKTLARESSIRTRRPVEVTISGMASMPKATSLPYITEPPIETIHFSQNQRVSNKSPSRKDKNIGTDGVNTFSSSRAVKNVPKNTKSNHQPIAIDTDALIPSKLERFDKFASGNRVIKTSAENWLPDSFRMRSRIRELAIAQENLDEIIVRELDQAREQKRISVPIYDTALNKESLSMVKKHPCGCCLQKYLYVNLPLKVSQKAIIDIRVKWTGSMTSSTVFGGTRAMTAASLDDDSIQKPRTNTLGDTSSPTKGETVEIYQKMHVSRSSINVYDQVLVCLFCSQFFQSQEEYRPSYAEMVHSEKRASHLEALERERQYWDPLKMVEKDKEAEEAEKAAEELFTTKSNFIDNIVDVNDNIEES
eukprot:CAMPEP_0119045794 /NCGR_PEP_ID=MMETSP1177-20130426/42651_1 /TAXON_ID=2985 /ORGANISM="Ochromonas sp, Strain CCMP1899" /LENGTH=412 /DNA_ID=CAMNT_0007018155 /DNA_START=89 /DNA_END=1327 /DNA_ORIENTATION=+